MKIGERITIYRKRSGQTQEELAGKLGKSVMTIRRWEKGERKPRVDDIEKLASALGVSTISLISESDDLPEPNLRLAKDDALATYFLVDKKVSCGKGNQYDENSFKVISERQTEDGNVAALCCLYPAKKLFGIIAEGDSMEPEIHEGDTVLFMHDSEDWSVGNQMVVCYEDKLFVKGIVSGGGGKFPVVLRSFNKDYPDIIVKRDHQFDIIGRVLRIIPASKQPKSII